MRRIFSFAASAAFLLGLFSCQEKEGALPPPESGDILKHVSLTLQESGATRSTTAAEEFAIGEATVFVYQSGPSGEVLYETVQTESSTVGVDLLFTDAVDYTYRFEAYANMGELTEAPLEVSFEDESSEGFQMHGSLSGVDASSASSATVMLDRYVGRVVVGSVKLQWKDQSNASQEFTLKRMWVANAAALYGGGAAYNVGGAYVASAMDALLVSEVNQVIADGGTYEVPHYLYAYASGSTALVLECEWAGQTMYYHVDYEPVANSSMTYSLSIHQTGSSEPLGDVTDDALVAAGALQANDWNGNESSVNFGDKLAEVRIQHVDGELYSVDEWTNSGFQSTEAVGVHVTDGTHEFVIHPTTEYSYSNSQKWAPTTGSFCEKEVPDVLCTDDELIAKKDLCGVENTYLITQFSHEYSCAVQNCRNCVFDNGLVGYMPAAGEMWLCSLNLEAINNCLSAIDGTLLSGRYWTSTQYSNSKAWTFNFSTNEFYYSDKYLSNSMLAPKARVFGSEFIGNENIPEVPSDVIVLSENVPMILSVDNKFYTSKYWVEHDMDDSKAVGIALSDGEHGFVIHPTAEQNLIWSTTTEGISGLGSESQTDYSGFDNTELILDAIESGTIADAPAAQFCVETVFANGKTGYLPGTGEFLFAYKHELEINRCLDAIGGSLLFTQSYWTSTMAGSSNQIYRWDTSYKGTTNATCNSNYYVRPFSVL